MSEAPRVRALLTGVLLVLAAGGCQKAETKKDAAKAGPTPLAVPFAVAEERTLPRVLDVTGTLVPEAQAEVAAEASGRVVAVMVERGSAVKAGAVLARLDDTDARNQLREAEAAEAQAFVKLGIAPGQTYNPAENVEVKKVRFAMERARNEEGRYARLVKEGAVSQSEAEGKATDYMTAKEEYEAALQRARELNEAYIAARARTRTARKTLADSSIRAPFEGSVAERHVNVGQFLQRSAKVATLVRVDPLRIELMVPEVATVAVKRAEKVSFAVQAYPDRRFEGQVKYVGPSLRTDSRALVVEAIVPNPERLLHPGFFATASIELPATEPSVLVPAAAIRTDAGVSRVFVLKNGHAEQRMVQIGRDTGTGVEIVRGVKSGEHVAVGEFDKLTDGAAVTERGS
jgi:RND family efflux transporter MFP subunit